MNQDRQCLECGKKFNVSTSRQAYCSYDCRNAAQRKRTATGYRWTPAPRACVQCAASFLPVFVSQTICSAQCLNERNQPKHPITILINRGANTEPARVRVSRKCGLTEQQAHDLISEQQGKCALCLVDLNTLARVDADHCHNTHTLRGLLCHPCNIRLTMMHEDAAFAMRVHNYLTDPPAVRLFGHIFKKST